jgi:glutamate dehydrogenase (NADP+)
MRRAREDGYAQLKTIMHSIHENCVKYGKVDGFVDYVKGANTAAFVKVADAMVQQGYV